MKNLTFQMMLVATMWLAACGGERLVGAPLEATPDATDSDTVLSAPELDTPTAPTPDVTQGCVADAACTTDEAPPCHQGACIDGVCVVVPVNDLLPCDDGNPCTSETYCEAGSCSGGRATSCADGNPCTVDACDPLTGCSHDPAEDGGACDDDNPCSLGDVCTQGMCLGAPDPACECEADADCAMHEDGNLCNGSLTCQEGLCHLDLTTVTTCPPAGACELTACQPATGSCATHPAPNGTGCDDANPCTVDDRCSEGLCEGTPGTCPCDVDADCAVLQTENYDLCQGPLQCGELGICVPDTTLAVVCTPDADGDDCIEVQCNPGTGLCATVARQDGAGCAGDGPCAPEGQCESGACVTVGDACDDGNSCTDDICLGPEGCSHEPRTGTACSDEDACTSDDLCVDGVCTSGNSVVCDDLDPCTVDKCASAFGGCTSEPAEDGAPCNTADLCVGPGVCSAGSCVGGDSVACPAAGPCQSVLCNPNEGCVTASIPDGTPCDDGDPCTQPGTCVEGSCDVVPIACNDGNPCTMDSCDASGCLHLAVSDATPCETGDPCEEGGACLSGECLGATTVTCPSGLCDVKSCDPSTGNCVVSHTIADGTECGATTACDIAGACSEGTCVGTAQVSCDDSNACTTDACEPEFGLCKHSPVHCGPDPESPCAVATCDAVDGCAITTDLDCTEESLLWHTTLECDQGTEWAWGEDMGHPLFVLTDAPPAAGPLAEGCHAQIVVPEAEVAVDVPWTSTLLSPEVEVTIDPAIPVVVRFWHTWEWAGEGANDDVERRVQLINEESQVVGSVPLDSDAGAWAAWTQSEVSLFVDVSGTYRVAFTLTSKPTDNAPGYTWTIDHIVVYAGYSTPVK